MKTKRIFLLLGHPDASGMCGAFADAYEASAQEAGHEVIRMNIGEMQFDPILHKGYRAIQELEPDLKRFQEAVQAADHFVVVYPVWWVGMPAILKGLFDRAWPQYRKPLEDNWAPYVRGEITRAQAIERTLAALTR